MVKEFDTFWADQRSEVLQEGEADLEDASSGMQKQIVLYLLNGCLYALSSYFETFLTL